MFISTVIIFVFTIYLYFKTNKLKIEQFQYKMYQLYS